MKKFVLLIFAALLAGCAVPGPVVYCPVQTVVFTCPTETIAIWAYNPKTLRWDCVIPVESPTVVVVQYPYTVIRPAVHYPRVGWAVVVVIHSGGYR